MKRLGHDFLRLFFPESCTICKGPKVAAESFVCSSCLIRLPRERNYHGLDNNTATRLLGMFRFHGAYSFFRFAKKSDVQKLIHQIKYKGGIRLANQLGVWFASEVLLDITDHFELITPVPLHKVKLESRGYNQSLEIARGISHITKHPVIQAVERIHQAGTQTHLNRWDRFENTLNDFRLTCPRKINGKRVLLLDDIITTGATISGSARPLLEGKVKSIVVAAIGLTQNE